jgi:heme/copper-type cytochrome/quinol oxidase subunit 2
MKVSTTSKDILKWVIIAVVVIAVGVILIRMVKLRNQRAKEKVEEDQKILNTPINDLAKDDLEDKYL